MNKKGFTTMELLAVVIVLVILSLVTTSVVTVVIENADKAAAQDSAHGYVEALDMEIMESNYSSKKLIKSGYYYAQYFVDELGFNTGGEMPKQDSWVYIKDDEVKEYSLKFKKYSATKLDDEVVVDKTVSEHDTCFKLSVKYKDLYNYGDSYSCYVGDGKVRTFYLLEDGDSESSTGKTPKGKLSLIMKNNLVENYNEEEITELTKEWINVDIPTKEQIEKSTKQDFLKLEENYIVSNGSSNTVMTKNGFNDTETNYGYRPVIVIEK